MAHVPSILTLTTLFPNPVQPAHGAFVATRLEKLLATGGFRAEVIAPVPWVPPFVNYKSLGHLARVPHVRRWGEVNVHHPRYLILPKLGMQMSPHSLYVTLKLALQRLLAEGRQREIAEYCLRDVKATVLLYQIWKERLAGIK